MEGALERYQKLGLRESLSRSYDYPSGCNELSFILRGAYNKVSKNLQSIIFQDTLTAFRLLPQIETSRAIAAANLLLQAAEVALPKQKKALAITEFKHAAIAHKRRYKTQQHYEHGSAELPQDVLVHIFSFLDMHSLVSVGLVCWSWNLAASDNKLWQLQYAFFFGKSDSCSETKGLIVKIAKEKENASLCQKQEVMDISLDWREAFKGSYIGNSSWRFTSNRGYCGHCKSVAWVSNMKCANVHDGLNLENHQIKPILSQQVVEYLLEDSLSTISLSDSDSDSDEGSLSRLWAYPKNFIEFMGSF